MRYQIEASAGDQWHWRHAAADGDQEATLFDSREEAAAMLPGLAKALGCKRSELRIVDRPGFAESLAAMMDARSLTAYRLAEDAGLSRQAVAKLLAGSEPSWSTVQRIADALKVPVESLRDR